MTEDEAERRRAWLRRRVAELPPDSRNVCELVIYAEMPYREVARVLDVPLGTVKSRMARARKTFEMLPEEPDGNARGLTCGIVVSERTRS